MTPCPQSESTKYFSFVWWLLLFGGCAAFISWYTPLESEDILHCQSLSWTEAFSQAMMSYQLVNPRIGELLLYPLGMATDGTGSYQAWMFFRVVHPLLLSAAILFAIRLGTGSWPHLIPYSGIITLCLGMLVLSIRCDIFWLCGATNWLWPSVLCMALVILVEPLFVGNAHVSWKRFFAIVSLIPLLGMANETIAPFSLLALVAPGVYGIYRKRKVFSWRYIFLLGFLALFVAIFFLAPGREGRTEMSDWSISLNTLVFKSLLSSMWIHFGFFTYLRVFVLLAILGIGFRVYRLPSGHPRMWLSVLCFCLLWFPLFLAPSWGAPRAYHPLDMVFLIMFANLLSRLLPHMTCRGRWAVMACTIVLCSSMMVPLAAKGYCRYEFCTRMQELAEQAKNRGESRVVVRRADLHSSTLIPRIKGMPNSFLEQEITLKKVPLFAVKESVWAQKKEFPRLHAAREVFPYDTPKVQRQGIPTFCGDECLNRGFARYLGVKEVIYIKPDDEPSFPPGH